ncbi:MAG: CRISPR-associated protein Cas5 [Candidatus Absconditabacterales bacterium]|nr:CRISPR-associated protein Cas5 [Candidatus Absconditabacterales bacterium]
MNVFSFDLVGDFAMFKKNDANDIIFMTYNFIHKPAILGMIGAIMGYSGYSKSGNGKDPEYYEKLKDLYISIIPNYSKPLSKTIVGFNDSSGLSSTDSYNNANTWQVREQILVGDSKKIKYTIFIKKAGELESCIETNIKNGITKYPLYFGKNEFFAHYENYQTYKGTLISNGIGKIDSLVKIGFGEENKVLINENLNDRDYFDHNEFEIYKIYENLPYDFDENGFYKKDLFILTNKRFDFTKINNMFSVEKNGQCRNVQFI